MLGSVREAVAAVVAAHADLAAQSFDLLTRGELVAVLDELQTLGCQLPTLNHRLLARLQAEATPKEMGAKSWRDVLAIRWRISTGEAGRRLTEAAELGPRQTLTGQPLPPVLAHTAAAQAAGAITPEHVGVIREATGRIPAWVDPVTREQLEADWATAAMGVGPKELKDHAERTLFLLDQDGPEPDDAERQRRRGVAMSRQQPDAMTALKGQLTPEAKAIYETLFQKLAAPGMCNPADEHPCVSGTPSQAQIDGDDRTLGQRQHDAMVYIGRYALASGDLGQLNGLPTSIIVRTTLQDLESRAGVGVTAGGTIIPVGDLVHLASHSTASHYLAVFDRATGSALNLLRTRRTATAAQRIMLIAREGGCTKPGCTVPAYGTQVHHAARDWADGGLTNVDDLGLACGPDNRMVGPDGWTTRINEHHEVEWIPPADLDTGQARVNGYHRPERLHRPPDGESTVGPPPKNHDDSTFECSEPVAEADDQPDPPDVSEPGGPEPNAA